MVRDSYVPDRGDVIWLDLEPQSGSEITKRRPCLVLSPEALNQRTHKCFIIPITGTTPKIPTHLSLPNSLIEIHGSLLIEQMKSLDFVSRNAVKITELNDPELYEKIIEIVIAIITG